MKKSNIPGLGGEEDMICGACDRFSPRIGFTYGKCLEGEFYAKSTDECLNEKRKVSLKENERLRKLEREEKRRSEGRCVSCGRKLTHPISIGLKCGPVCGKHGYSKMEEI